MKAATVNLPTELESALDVIARAESKRNGKRVSAADVAAEFLRVAIASHVERFPILTAETYKAMGFSDSQIETLKMSMALKRANAWS